MGHEENQLQKDALPSTSTSRSGSSSPRSVMEGNEEREDSLEEHRDSAEDTQDHSLSVAKPSFDYFQRGGDVFWRGNSVYILARLLFHLTTDHVKVIPAWIQKIYEDEVVVYCRYGFLRVFKSAVLLHCHSLNQATMDQMKAVRTMGWNLDQLPLAREVFPGSILRHRQDSLSLPGSSESSSSGQCTRHPSSTSARLSTSRHDSPREVSRGRPRGNPHPRNQYQGSRSSFSDKAQRDQRFQGCTINFQQNSSQGSALMPSVQPAFCGRPAQPYVQAPTTFIVHTWSGYHPFQVLSQPCYPQYSMPGVYYGPSIQPSRDQ
ncbi:hypothetical protein RvY_05000 [Ramazzottius varieornatus]|uniref:Uncharacterized protein n=1 Tax=Ramazzottius varieornatus TaxID=947166 RepID=A0A1D1V3H2_RAMVA|nr:hypothetical protein RvY_05000 [Ramazzottius varieornatus]